MKKRVPPVTLLTTAAFVILIATACSKSKTLVPSSITATLGGKPWQSQFVVGIQPIGFNVITFIGYYGKAGDTSQLEIDILDSVKLNQPDPFFNTAIRYYQTNGITYDSDPTLGGHGSLTITAWDTIVHKITGTFSGVFYNSANSNDSITVANGQLYSTYTIE